MGAKPYYTSTDIVEAIKRKISFPISQNTFSDDDLLKFCNEEMAISQVPDVLQYHEEYFVYTVKVPLKQNVNRYAIPYRAIGMKLRDVMWSDVNNNLIEMTRIEPENKAFFQNNVGSNESVHKFYLEGNDIILTPLFTQTPTGSLIISFFLRPNQLVANSRAAIIKNFNETVTVSFANIVNGSALTIDDSRYVAVTTLGGSITATGTGKNTLITSATPHYLSPNDTVIISGSDTTPSIDGEYQVGDVTTYTFNITSNTDVTVAGTTGTWSNPRQFQIVTDSITTATNLTNVINMEGLASANNGNPSTAKVLISYDQLSTDITTNNSLGLSLLATQGIEFNSMPSNIVTGIKVDFLQTNPGHKTYTYDIKAQSISGNIGQFNYNDLRDPRGVALPIIIGDYICEAQECIIPQIPPDLHNSLADRVCARILAAIGDKDGLASANAKIAENNRSEGSIIDNRTEGQPRKVFNKGSLLHRRRWTSGRW